MFITFVSITNPVKTLNAQDRRQVYLHKPLTLPTVRNKDMSWPEEMSFIANSSKMDRHKGELGDMIKLFTFSLKSVVLFHFTVVIINGYHCVCHPSSYRERCHWPQ